MDIFETINRYRLVFWDFDGVIKESLIVKRASFAKLFGAHDKSVVAKITAHHDANGGMSRFEKIPRYLELVGIENSKANIQRYCEEYAAIVFAEVVDCPWVAGVEGALKNGLVTVPSILVTATPHEEIEEILFQLGIRDVFLRVYGAPKAKTQSIQESLEELEVAPNDALMLGDSELDCKAAQSNGIDFILRKTAFNVDFCARFKGRKIEDFEAS